MFSLEFENVDYQGISLITDNCTFLPAKSSCDINVVFDAKTAGKHQAKIIIDTNNEYIPAATSIISAEALANSNEIGVQLSSNSPELVWFTGGNLAWQLDDTEAAIMSGDIMDGRESPVILTFSAAGLLSFELLTDNNSTLFRVRWVIHQLNCLNFRMANTKSHGFTLKILPYPKVRIKAT